MPLGHGDDEVLVHNSAMCPSGLLAKWANRADFSSQKTMSKKYDAHAVDFGVKGNRNKVNMQAYQDAMKSHMTSPNTKIYRFNYRDQGQAVGFIDPSSNLMVMLRSDGTFWSGWRLSGNQFSSIVDKGYLR